MSYIARRNKLRESKVDALLVEYQVCATRADFHTQLIWTWASAMLGINAAGVGLLAQADKYSEGRFVLVSLLAAAATFLVWWWNLAADRWHVIIRVIYVRLDEIESHLGMRHNGYITLRNSTTFDWDHPDAKIQQLLREKTNYPVTGSVGLKDLRTLLIFGVPLTWILVLLAEAMAFVTSGRPCLTLLQSVICKPVDLVSYPIAFVLWILGLMPLAATAYKLWSFVKPSRPKAESATTQVSSA